MRSSRLPFAVSSLLIYEHSPNYRRRRGIILRGARMRARAVEILGMRVCAAITGFYEQWGN